MAEQSPIDFALIQQTTITSTARLSSSFFRVRFDRLTPREKDYLCALAEMGTGNQRSGGVAERLGVKVQTIAPLRSSLIKKRMIYSPAHGDTAFTVPLFDQFMLRTMPYGPRKATQWVHPAQRRTVVCHHQHRCCADGSCRFAV